MYIENELASFQYYIGKCNKTPL